MLRKSAPLLMAVLMLSFTGACATRSSTKEVRTVAATAASLTVVIPDTVKEPCVGAELPPPPKPSEKDYQVFGARQTAKLELCEGKRALAVDTMELHNRYVDSLQQKLDPPPWWKRVLPH